MILLYFYDIIHAFLFYSANLNLFRDPKEVVDNNANYVGKKDKKHRRKVNFELVPIYPG